MIFFQILLFFLSIVFVSLSISGYGRLVNLRIRNNFFLDIFLGLIIVSFLITIIHFFFRIDFKVSLLIFILGFFIFFKKKGLKSFDFFKIKNSQYLIIIFLFIPMYLSQKYHEDFGYYHLPYALAFLEEKIIFGFANINPAYVYNSIWLNLNSIFLLYDKNFNFLTLPSYLLFLSFVIFSLQNILGLKNIKGSDYYLVVSLFYFILKFTRISEYGVDFPAAVFSVLGIYYFIKFYEVDFDEEKKDYFYLNIIFCIFALLIKLSVLPIILLPFFLYIKNFKIFKFYIFQKKFLFIYFLVSLFFIQQFIYTGCFIFPTDLSCLNVSWFNNDYLKLSKQLELTNKSYSLAKNIYTPNEYLSNYTWFPFWLKRNYTEILEHVGTILIPVLLFTLFLKKKNINADVLKEIKLIYLFLFLSIIFWLNFSPVYRFGIYIFITLIYLLTINILISKEFSKKIFIIFIALFIFFNFSKNIQRLIKADEIFIGIQRIDNLYIKKDNYSNVYANVFQPNAEKNVKKNGWQGILCWDIPFICSWEKFNIDKKNSYLFLIK